MKKTLLFMTLIMLILPCISYSQSVTWDGGAGTTSWSDATNWSNDVEPTATTDVLLDLSGGATIDISGAAVAKTVEVKNSNILNIATGATLTIADGTDDDGLETAGSGVITNDGTISISTSSTNNIDGLYSKGTFTNNGDISIDGVGEHGLYVQEGTFTNNGTITITNVGLGDGGADGIYLDDNSGAIATIVNDGTINVTMTTGDDGVYIKDGCVFENNSMLTIDVSGGNDMGLHLVNPSSEFNNTGDVTITGGPDYCIQVDGANMTPAPFIENSGTMTVNDGSNDGIRLRRGGSIENIGTLTIDSSGDEAIQIDDNTSGENISTFNNSGTVDILNAGDHGLECFGNFNNMAGGIFQADGCGDDGVRMQNDNPDYNGLFTNDGEIKIDNSGSDDIDVEDANSFVNSSTAVFHPGSSPGDLTIRYDFDLGASSVNFEINGTAAVTDYDQILNKNSANTLTISGATANLIWGFTPAVDDCFKIVDESGGVAGPFASVTSDDPSIIYTVDYFSNSAEVIICVEAIVVPVEMTSFTGRKVERGTELNWETSSEINNAGFDIERSTNGSDWSQIGFVSGNGNSNRLLQYSYLDENPLEGTNFYRLKQNDFDGNFEYSDIVSLNYREDKNEISFYPNPVEDVLYISSNQNSENLEFQLVDINGKVLWSKKGDVKEISFENFSSGVYFLNIVSPSNRITKKIVHN